MADELKLGRITSTRLGKEDHGILTFWLDLDYGGTGQGFGGYSLGGDFTSTVIEGILEAVGVDNWEDLKGEVVWVKRDGPKFGGKIIAIKAPDFVERAKWFDIEEASKKFLEKSKP